MHYLLSYSLQVVIRVQELLVERGLETHEVVLALTSGIALAPTLAH